MIPKALNPVRSLPVATKLARRMLASQKSNFSVFHFLQAMQGASRRGTPMNFWYATTETE